MYIWGISYGTDHLVRATRCVNEPHHRASMLCCFDSLEGPFSKVARLHLKERSPLRGMKRMVWVGMIEGRQ
ncbi:hypothetical protein AVEN_48380-1, partial [Araneus ventricosus]